MGRAIPGKTLAQAAVKRCRALQAKPRSTRKTIRRSRSSRPKPRHINGARPPGSSMLRRQLCAQLLVTQHPTDAACDVLQTKDMEIFPIHAGNAVRQNHHLIVEVEGSERCLEYAGVGVDAHQADGTNTEAVEQDVEIGPHKAVEPFLVIDDVVALLDKPRDDFGSWRAF